MALKGKIEAVIYAAEEPVTLDQISFLLKQPVLQHLAEERERAQAAAAELAAAEAQAAPQEAGSEQHSDVETGLEPIQDGAQPDSHPIAETIVHRDSSTAAELERRVAEDVAAANSETESTQDETAGPQVTAPAIQTDASEQQKPSIAAKRRLKADIPPEVRARVRSLIEELMSDYADSDRGMEIRQVAGGYRMATKPEHHDVVKTFAKSLKPPLRLSMPALETLAVIAYKQPVTAPEVGEIRGVDSQGVIATLLDRKLVTTAGRKAVIGRPILYRTTKDFLLRFGLKDVSELPSMEEFEKLAQEAGQVDIFQVDEEDAAAPSPGDNQSGENGTAEEIAVDETVSLAQPGVAPGETGDSGADNSEAAERPNAERDNTGEPVH
jgi:segregation and condensation protein B